MRQVRMQGLVQQSVNYWTQRHLMWGFAAFKQQVVSAHICPAPTSCRRAGSRG